MTIFDYFKLRSSPSPNSPVGKLMARVLEHQSNFEEFETLKLECREALLGVGGATRQSQAYKRLYHARNAKNRHTGED